MELRMVFKCDKFHPSALAVSQIYPSPMATPWVMCRMVVLYYIIPLQGSGVRVLPEQKKEKLFRISLFLFFLNMPARGRLLARRSLEISNKPRKYPTTNRAMEQPHLQQIDLLLQEKQIVQLFHSKLNILIMSLVMGN